MIIFMGQSYFDDRMYVLYLCKATSTDAGEGLVETTIYHDQPPAHSVWCIATFRNCITYPLHCVNLFDLKHEALEYWRTVEPTVPLISLNGASPKTPLPYDEYMTWKKKNKFKEYDIDLVYSPGARNRKEIALNKIDDFVKRNPSWQGRLIRSNDK